MMCLFSIYVVPAIMDVASAVAKVGRKGYERGMEITE